MANPPKPGPRLVNLAFLERFAVKRLPHVVTQLAAVREVIRAIGKFVVYLLLAADDVRDGMRKAALANGDDDYREIEQIHVAEAFRVFQRLTKVDKTEPMLGGQEDDDQA